MLDHMHESQSALSLRNDSINIRHNLPIFLILKGKAAPLQAWSGPEGSRKLRFPDFMTMAQEGGTVVSLTHWPHLPPGNSPGTHLLEAEATPGP